LPFSTALGSADADRHEEARHAAPMTPAAAPTLTLGIDLAAQARNTAVCLLAWPRAAPPEFLMLGRGASAEGAAFDDEWLAGTATGRRREHPGEVTKVGIDDPLGWPVPFLDALAAHRDGPLWLYSCDFDV
jgi:hypothetical protein